MSELKSKIQNIDPFVKARDIKQFIAETGNMYESLVAISKRANKISDKLKKELHNKLEEFSSSSDTIEEIHENKEQIEISKFYERFPNPAIIATEEYFNGELNIKYPEEEKRG
jgi:DNA-directed RNA polymerase subunit K/omega